MILSSSKSLLLIFRIFNIFSEGNVFSLIAQREISPRTKHIAKSQRRDASKREVAKNEREKDVWRGLLSWYTLFKGSFLFFVFCFSCLVREFFFWFTMESL